MFLNLVDTPDVLLACGLYHEVMVYMQCTAFPPMAYTTETAAAAAQSYMDAANRAAD